jgi:putative transposase
MARQRRFKRVQIIHKLREADVLTGQGLSTPEGCRRLEVSDKTYYRWRRSYGGMKVDQAKRFKELE